VDNKAIVEEAGVIKRDIDAYTTTKTTQSIAWAKIVKEIVSVEMMSDDKLEELIGKHTSYGESSVSLNIKWFSVYGELNKDAKARIFEELASEQHNIWSHWMVYLFSVCETNEDGSVTIPSNRVKWWTRQINTAYSDLSEKEKEGDREQVRKLVPILNNNVLCPYCNLSVCENPQVCANEQIASGLNWDGEVPI